LNAERSPQFVTVRDDVDLAVFRRFDVSTRLHPRHPLLFKGMLAIGQGKMTKPEDE